MLICLKTKQKKQTYSFLVRSPKAEISSASFLRHLSFLLFSNKSMYWISLVLHWPQERGEKNRSSYFLDTMLHSVIHCTPIPVEYTMVSQEEATPVPLFTMVQWRFFWRYLSWHNVYVTLGNLPTSMTDARIRKQYQLAYLGSEDR